MPSLTWPASRSLIACPPPRYDTCSSSMPASLANHSVTMCCPEFVPLPVAKRSPGCFFTCATSSAMVLTPSVGMRRQHDRLARQLDHRGEVLELVVDLVNVRIARHRVGRDQDGVAVGRALGRRFGADVAVGAGAVLHHHLLAERARQIFGDQPRRDVGRTAGGKRNDHADRFVRPVLGLNRQRSDGGKRRQRRQSSNDPHHALPRVALLEQ